MAANPWEREIAAAARRVTQLQAVRRKLRKRLKDMEKELREAKRDLRKLVGALAENEFLAPRKTVPGLGMVGTAGRDAEAEPDDESCNRCGGVHTITGPCKPRHDDLV